MLAKFCPNCIGILPEQILEPEYHSFQTDPQAGICPILPEFKIPTLTNSNRLRTFRIRTSVVSHQGTDPAELRTMHRLSLTESDFLNDLRFESENELMGQSSFFFARGHRPRKRRKRQSKRENRKFKCYYRYHLACFRKSIKNRRACHLAGKHLFLSLSTNHSAC